MYVRCDTGAIEQLCGNSSASQPKDAASVVKSLTYVETDVDTHISSRLRNNKLSCYSAQKNSHENSANTTEAGNKGVAASTVLKNISSTQQRRNLATASSADSSLSADTKRNPHILVPNVEMKNIRLLLSQQLKLKNMTYLRTKNTFSKILNRLAKLAEFNSDYTGTNQICLLFLKMLSNVFACETLNGFKINELFNIIINCYVLTFKYFTKRDKYQILILFNYIFDLILVNSTSDRKHGNSYLNYVKDHKLTNQLTIMNLEDFGILLYYLTQLLFELIGLAKLPKEFLNFNLNKLLAFLIFSKNIEILRIFREKRKAL